MTAPEPTFSWSMQTIVSEEDSSPWIALNIWYWKSEDDYDTRSLIANWKWDPHEARIRGSQLMLAADAAESDAALVMVLRERKTPEEEIQEIITEIRNRRARAV